MAKSISRRYPCEALSDNTSCASAWRTIQDYRNHVRWHSLGAMRKKTRVCEHDRCSEPPFLGGLCQRHHEEESSRRQLRDDAVRALHAGVVDGGPLKDPELEADWLRLVDRWHRVCLVVQTAHGTPEMPHEEAEYATDWCISLAQEIIKATRARMRGDHVASSLAMTRQWVWERFDNLERGLRSNGTSRTRAT